MNKTVNVRASRKALRDLLATIPASAKKGGQVADAMMTRCGLAVLARIKQAFIVKARGGTDEAGDSWPPLSPKTIAYSKTRKRGRSKADKKKAEFPSQALSKKQQDRWWQVYKQALATYKGDKSHAAAVAWFVLKKEGAQTLVDKYGHKKVDILRDTGLLLNSLSPGVASPHRIFKAGQGEVIVGTNRVGASAHHRGVPGRLPQRRLWPPPSKWPDSWWRDIIDQCKQGLLDLAAEIIKKGP